MLFARLEPAQYTQLHELFKLNVGLLFFLIRWKIKNGASKCIIIVMVMQTTSVDQLHRLLARAWPRAWPVGGHPWPMDI